LPGFLKDPSLHPLTEAPVHQWIDPSDNNTLFLRQNGNRVVRFYDYGSGKRIIGEYIGTFEDGVLRYSWRWLECELKGHGAMRLDATGKSMKGEWWYNDNRTEVEPIQYCRVSNALPPWITEDAFRGHEEYLKGKLPRNPASKIGRANRR
jgi:hypothetical protein